jgi:hypothetical protein
LMSISNALGQDSEENLDSSKKMVRSCHSPNQYKSQEIGCRPPYRKQFAVVHHRLMIVSMKSQLLEGVVVFHEG